MKLAAILILLAGLCCPAALAQSEEPQAVTATLYGGLTAALPIGQLREAYPAAQAFGATMGFLVKPGRPTLPFEVGLEASYLLDGISKNKALTATPPYTIKTAHSYIPVHAVLRLKPRRPMFFTPYADALAGITIWNTRSKIKQDFFSGSSEEDAIVLDKYNATVLSYGLAAGIRIKTKSDLPHLDLRLVYLEGPLGTYVRKGNLTVDQEGYPVYRFTRSETSMLLLQLNVAGFLPAP